MLYLAGPMTGIPEWNAPAFTWAKERAQDLGWEVVNPSGRKNHHRGKCPPGVQQGDHTHACWMRSSLHLLLLCDAVLMLKGWEGSRGATTEFLVAQATGMTIYYELTSGLNRVS